VSGVEFLTQDGSSGEAPPPPEPRPPRIRSRWWGLAALGCAALAVGYVLTRPSGPARPAAAAPSPPAAAARVVASPPANPCAHALYCKITQAVPVQLRTAVRHYLPTADNVRVRTQFGAGPIRSYMAARTIDIHTPTSTVLIVVHPLAAAPDNRPSAIVDPPLGFGSAVVHRRLGDFDVDIQYVAPETVTPALDSLRQLAGDPRLVAP
jgi:hypothetical protein